jgi:hypothetical protein
VAAGPHVPEHRRPARRASPRRFFARTLAKLPVVGLAGGWLDERGGIRKAAEETEKLLTR